MPITVQHAKNVTVADWAGVVTVANSTGGTGTNQASNLARATDWNSAHAVTLSVTGSEIASLFSFNNGLSSTTNGAGITAGVSSVGYFEPHLPSASDSTLTAPGIGTWYIEPVNLPFALGSGQINVLLADAAGFLNGNVYSATSTGSASFVQTLNLQLALYQLGTSNSTTRLESKWSADASMLATRSVSVNGTVSNQVTASNYLTLSFPAQWDASGGVTYSSTSQSGTVSSAGSTMASTRANSLITGAVAYLSGSRMHIWPFATSLSAGQYWLAHMFTSTSASAGTRYTAMTMWSTQSVLMLNDRAGAAFRLLGKSVSDASSAFQQFQGSIATVSSTPFNTLGTSDVRGLTTSNAKLYWNYAQSTY